MTDEALAREAIRVYRRYAVEIVEGLVFCPYAERAREDGRTAEVVIGDADPSDAEVLAAVSEIAAQPEVELALVILPRSRIGRGDLGRWVETLRKAHAAAHGGTVLAIEGFHPDAEADLESAERLTPFVRRTPDPTLQLTRLDALERVRRGSPTGTAFFDPATADLDAFLTEAEKRPLHERIAEMNYETVQRLGADEVRRRMDAILGDRDEAYRAIDPTIVLRLSPAQARPGAT